MNLPTHVKQTLKTLEAGGHSAYLVGGCVRDMVMGQVPKDWDVTTDALPETVQALFPQTIPTGLAHGTVTVITGPQEQVEVTTLRRDGQYKDHRRPQSVTYVSDIAEDLARRDFTMNAMALTLEGTLLDPFGGREDIRKKRIRAVGEPEARFEEDALRMFRALRFSAVLGFAIHPKTAAAIREKSHLAQDLSAERLRDELEKILLSTRPQILAEVLESGLIAAYLSGPLTPAGRKILRRMGRWRTPAKRTQRWTLFSAVLLQIGAITSPADFLRTLRLDNRIIKIAAPAAKLAQGSLPKDTVALKRLLARYGVDVMVSAVGAAVLLDKKQKRAAWNVRRILSRGDCFSLNQLAIDGKDLLALGAEPGAQVGKLLHQLLDHVINQPEDNERETLLSRAHSLLTASEVPPEADK